MIINKTLASIANFLTGKTMDAGCILHHHTGEGVMVPCQRESRQIRRSKQRAAEKAVRSERKAENEVYYQVSYLLKKAIPENQLDEIANNIGLIERKRKLTALAFASVLIASSSCEISDGGIKSLRRMCLLLRKHFNFIDIRPQALQQKINSEKGSKFIKEVMSRILAYRIDKILKRNLRKHKGKIASLYRILLQDSTVIPLPPSLSRIFRGCGGAGSRASVKFDFIIDQCNHLIIRVKLVAGRIPDAKMSGDIIDYLGENDLVIRDLGYFNLTQLSRIMDSNSFFISRLSKSAHVYRNKDDLEPLDLIDYLGEIGIENKGVDIDLYVGKIERLHVRLIGIKVPPEVVELRRLKYKIYRNKQEPSDELQHWNSCTLMITNLPREKISLKTIIKIYKIRWQIELFFKNMKSNLQIAEMSGINKHRILSVIYIRIVITWVVTCLYAYAQGLAGEKREVSLDQFTKWLKDDGRLKGVFITGDFCTLLKEIERDLELLCKQKRRRKTTLSDIEESFQEDLNNEKIA